MQRLTIGYTHEAVKSTSRISSDTDNETDRLLGSQRNDQLQKTSNNDSNSGSIESQTSNNFTKQQQASSREGKFPSML